MLYDPIHNFMSIDDRVLKIVDTPEFQRLRDLKQLGACNFVYSAASHTRFEHSMGVSFLSGKEIDHMAMTQPWVRPARAWAPAVVVQLQHEAPITATAPALGAMLMGAGQYHGRRAAIRAHRWRMPRPGPR